MRISNSMTGIATAVPQSGALPGTVLPVRLSDGAMVTKALNSTGRLILALSAGQEIKPGVRRLPCRLVVRQSCAGKAQA